MHSYVLKKMHIELIHPYVGKHNTKAANLPVTKIVHERYPQYG